MKNFKKLLSVVASLVLLFGTFAIPQSVHAASTAYNFGSLTFGCTNGVQNGIVVPPTQANFAGCTVTVYVHGTSTLALTMNSANGTTMTNPIVLTLGTGTVTTSGTTVTGVTGTVFPTSGAWVNQTITINGTNYTIASVTNGTTLTTVQTIGTNATAVSFSVSPQTEQVYLQDGAYDVCVANAGSTPVLYGGCNYNLIVAQGDFNTNLKKAVLTSAFTDANSAALQAITGLTFTIPSTYVGTVLFHCAGGYSQATPSAGNQFGVAQLTTAPTRIDAVAQVGTNVTTTQYGPLTNLTTTTPTAIVTFTTVPSTVLPFYVDGAIQTAGGGAQTFQLYVLNGTAANVIAIAPGSYCQLL